MSAYTLDCPPDDCGACGTLPPGFVRLRYFYGKRLGVLDFVDEQRYHSGKQRFHNQRLHGAGVLCGLGTTLFTAGETVLRVGKGAALDQCGRELVVGYDQCIDVDAWYGRFRAEQLNLDPQWKPTIVDGHLQLCVALRYRECASSPEPAPRDPCACDATGSDYGRVREEFELALLAHDDAFTHVPPAIAPPRAKLDPALANAVGGADLAGRVRDALLAGCSEADANDWLILACFGAVLDATNQHVTKIDDLAATATMLYSTALIEELLGRSVGATLEAGALAAGSPEITALGIKAGGSNDFAVLTLSAPVVKSTALAATYTLVGFDPTSGWLAPVASVTPDYADGALELRVSLPKSTFVKDTLYRLAIAPAAVGPIVDAKMRPLHPLRPSYHFKVRDDGGTLVVGPSPFQEAP